MRSLILILLLFCPALAWAQLCTQAQLNTEFTTDPGTVGYSTCAVTDDACILAKLNGPCASGSCQLNRGVISGVQLQAALDPAEFGALTALQLTELQTLFILGSGSVDVSKGNVRTILASMFPAAGPTRTALVAAVSRQGTRAEIVCKRAATLCDVSLGRRGDAC
jgi:hypothetical protein